MHCVLLLLLVVDLDFYNCCLRLYIFLSLSHISDVTVNNNYCFIYAHAMGLLIIHEHGTWANGCSLLFTLV